MANYFALYAFLKRRFHYRLPEEDTLYPALTNAFERALMQFNIALGQFILLEEEKEFVLIPERPSAV
jgi:hypothetical protein